MSQSTTTSEYTRYQSLQGRSVFITGGATGIGAALVEAFVVQGAQVVFIDIDEAASLALCTELVAKGHKRPWFKTCDVSDIAALCAAISEAAKLAGEIDILINNAANDMRYETAHLSEQDWHQGLAINLHPVFFAAQAVQPGMAAKGGGAIINISSINVYFAPPKLVSYIAAKAGILGISKALATDFGVDNIRVNSILPGWVATPKQLEKWLTEAEEAELMKRVCLKKRLSARDVASMALFLASDDAAMITAQEFVVDGGRI
jgi:D-xylose 1-dehydrogenase